MQNTDHFVKTPLGHPHHGNFVDIFFSSRYYLHMDIEALWDILSDPIHFRIVTFKNVDSK